MQREKSKGIQRPIDVDSVRGIDTNNDKHLDELAIVIRLKEGSEPIQLNETVILVKSKALNCSSLEYGSSAVAGCAFNISYLKRGPDYEMDRLGREVFADPVIQSFSCKESLIPDLLELLKKEYEEDIAAPACCPVTRKGTYPGERRR